MSEENTNAATSTDTTEQQPASTTTNTAGATPPANSPNGDQQQTATPPATGEEESKLERALRVERSARKEAEDRAKKAGDEAATRAAEAEQRYQQTMDKLAGALGFKADDAPPDPTVLQRTIAERDNELGDVKSRIEALTAEKDAAIRERDVEIAAWRAASRQGANVPALLDSRTFLQGLARLDPTAESFNTDLDEAVKAALTANISLRATPPVPPPNEAGIGAAGAKNAPHVTPGIGRLRAAYS